MSRECQILFLMVLICISMPLVSSDEDCERSEIKKEWSVTCDSQTHQRDYCIPGQRVNDPCSSDNVCDYCPEGQFQNVYTNCKTCKNCTTLDHCCPGQVLIRQCASDKDAKCGCPEEQTPSRCPTCPTVCNTTNQTSTSDDTPVSSLSSDNPNGDTTSWILSSDTDGTTSSPTSAKDTLSSGCKCVGWKIGFAVAVLLCVILFGVVVCLCLKGNGALRASYARCQRRWQQRRSDQVDKDRQENELPLIDADLKEKKDCQLHERNAEPEKTIQQSERSTKDLPDSMDAAVVIHQDKIGAGSNSQKSSLERDQNSAPVELDGTTMPAEHQKDHEGYNTASATTTNISGPSSANRERAQVVRKDFLAEYHVSGEGDLLGSIRPQEWKDLGRKLGLKDPELDAIETKYADHKERVYQMLLTWKMRKGDDATYRSLGEALKDIGRKDLCDNFFKMYM